MVWFGDIFVTAIIEQDVSSDREIVEKDFVDSGRQAIGFPSRLETGIYDVLIHQNHHVRDEDIKEQRDAMFSMTSRNAFEFPYSFKEDVGFISVEQVNVSFEPNVAKSLPEISIRFLPLDEYHPGISKSTTVLDNDYDVETDGVVAVPAIAEEVSFFDLESGDITSASTEATISTVDGDVDLYSFNGVQLVYDPPSTAYDIEQVAPVRLYDHNNSLDEDDWSRVYSDMWSFQGGAVIDNGTIRIFCDVSDDDDAIVQYYDGSSWNDAGHLRLDTSDHYIVENSNYKVVVEAAGLQITLRRGHPILQFVVNGTDAVVWDTSDADDPVDGGSDEGLYVRGDQEDFSYVLVTPKDEGSKAIDGTLIQWSGLDDEEDYVVNAGIAMNDMDETDLAEWSLVRHHLNRDLFVRSATGFNDE